MKRWERVTIGVGDLDGALAFWVGKLGFEVEGRADGSDPGLESHWGLETGRITEQALLRAPGCAAGALHLVRFHNAGPTVRASAAVFDRCPKNLDIYVDDMPARFAQLRAAGVGFRNDNYSELTSPDGVHFREIHLPGHDDINLVLLQLMDHPPAIAPNGFAGIGPLVTTVANAVAEKAFYRDVIGLVMLHDNLLGGPEIERMIGLPPGAALDVSIWGSPGEHLGQVEIVCYQGTEGADLYPRAKPGNRGIFQLVYRTDDLDAVRARLDRASIRSTASSRSGVLIPDSEILSFQSPAGMSIEVESIPAT